MAEHLCTNCQHNCGKPPIVKKADGKCWCNAHRGKIIKKITTQCDDYEAGKPGYIPPKN